MATTWSSTGTYSVKAACTTGTESAPTSSSDGLVLNSGSGIGSIVIFVESNDGVTTLTTGTVDFYYYNPISTHWCKMLGYDGSIPGGSIYYSLPGIMTNAISRIAAVPNGLGTAVNIYLNGLPPGVVSV